RHFHVTGVQTCALPISSLDGRRPRFAEAGAAPALTGLPVAPSAPPRAVVVPARSSLVEPADFALPAADFLAARGAGAFIAAFFPARVAAFLPAAVPAFFPAAVAASLLGVVAAFFVAVLVAVRAGGRFFEVFASTLVATFCAGFVALRGLFAPVFFAAFFATRFAGAAFFVAL